MIDKGQNPRDVLRRKASLSLDPPIQLLEVVPSTVTTSPSRL